MFSTMVLLEESQHKILQLELVLVGKVRNIYTGTSGTYSVGTNWAGIPGTNCLRKLYEINQLVIPSCKSPQGLQLLTGRL